MARLRRACGAFGGIAADEPRGGLWARRGSGLQWQYCVRPHDVAPLARVWGLSAGGRMNGPLVVVGASAGGLVPLALRGSDLAQVQGDRLLAAVRARLRRDHDFPGPGQRFGVAAIHAGGSPMGLAPARDAAGGAAPVACPGYGPMGACAAWPLYTSDAADEQTSVDVGGSSSIKKTNRQ